MLLAKVCLHQSRLVQCITENVGGEVSPAKNDSIDKQLAPLISIANAIFIYGIVLAAGAQVNNARNDALERSIRGNPQTNAFLITAAALRCLVNRILHEERAVFFVELTI